MRLSVVALIFYACIFTHTGVSALKLQPAGNHPVPNNRGDVNWEQDLADLMRRIQPAMNYLARTVGNPNYQSGLELEKVSGAPRLGGLLDARVSAKEWHQLWGARVEINHRSTQNLWKNFMHRGDGPPPEARNIGIQGVSCDLSRVRDHFEGNLSVPIGISAILVLLLFKFLLSMITVLLTCAVMAFTGHQLLRAKEQTQNLRTRVREATAEANDAQARVDEAQRRVDEARRAVEEIQAAQAEVRARGRRQ